MPEKNKARKPEPAEIREDILDQISNNLRKNGLQDSNWINVVSQNVALELILESLSRQSSQDKQQLLDSLVKARKSSSEDQLDDITFAIEFAEHKSGLPFVETLRKTLARYLQHQGE